MRNAAARFASRPIVREGAAAIAGQVLAAVGTLVGGRILTSVVPADVFGFAALVVGISALARGCLVSPILQASLRFFPQASRDGRLQASRTLFRRLTIRFGGLAAGVVVVSISAWAATKGSIDLAGAAWAGAALLAVESLGSLEANLLNSLRRQRAFGVWTAVSAWARPLAAAVLVWCAGPSAAGIVAGYVIGAWLANATLPGVRGDDDPGSPGALAWQSGMIGEIRRFAWPFAAISGLSWVTNIGDRYLLAAWASVGDVGVYAACYGLASQPPLMLSAALTSWLRPVLFEASTRGEASKAARAIRLWTLLAIAGAAVVVGTFAAFGELVVKLLLGRPFWGGAPLLAWIAAAYGAQAVQQVFDNVIQVRGLTSRLMPSQVASAVIAAGCYAALIPSMGSKGAAIATLAAFVGSGVCSFAMAGGPRVLRASGWVIPDPLVRGSR